MATEHEIRRNSDGSIDMTFYKARSRHLRQAARAAFFQVLWRGALGLIKSAVRRPARPIVATRTMPNY